MCGVHACMHATWRCMQFRGWKVCRRSRQQRRCRTPEQSLAQRASAQAAVPAPARGSVHTPTQVAAQAPERLAAQALCKCTALRVHMFARVVSAIADPVRSTCLLKMPSDKGQQAVAWKLCMIYNISKFLLSISRYWAQNGAASRQHAMLQCVKSMCKLYWTTERC